MITNKKIKLALAALTLSAISLVQLPQASAQERERREQPGVSRTEAPRPDTARSAPFEAPYSLQYNVGIFDGRNELGSESTNFLTGPTVDFNLSELVNLSERTGIRALDRMYFGATVGALWTPAEGLEVDENANLFMVPWNGKVGYKVLDQLLVNAHGGVTTYIESAGDVSAVGDATGNATEVTFVPNVGVDISLGLTRNIGLVARSDWSLADESTPYMGTLGATFALD